MEYLAPKSTMEMDLKHYALVLALLWLYGFGGFGSCSLEDLSSLTAPSEKHWLWHWYKAIQGPGRVFGMGVVWNVRTTHGKPTAVRT